jgi:hypothetical protein
MAMIKKHKIPTAWDETTSRIVNDLFEDLYREAQSKYLSEVSAKPKDTEGRNGEMRSDIANGKVYIKQNGAWKEITLS